MNVVVDDHLLREYLLDQEPRWLHRSRRGGQVFTTGGWYYRLCSALQDPDTLGSLSGPIAQLPGDLRTEVVQRVASLPSTIRLLSLRDIAWEASGLGRRHGLNLVAAEALAAAVRFKAAIATSESNVPPRLRAAAAHEGVRVITAPGV